jgi:hypothetical protein
LTRPLGDLASPQGVREVVRQRLSRLSRATTELLELAAVVGSQFELSVVEAASRSDSVVGSLEEALASGTIAELPGPGLLHRFSHELVRRALYDRLPAVRRAELHLRVGEAFEQVHAASPDRVLQDLAHHFAIAAPRGGRERAVYYNLRAAEAALSLFAFRQAEAFARTALELAGESGAAHAQADYLLGTAEYRLGKSTAAERASAAAAAFGAIGDAEAAAEAELLVCNSLRYQGRGDDGDAAVERALALVRDRGPSRAKASALIRWAGTLNVGKGRPAEALRFASEGLALAEELGLAPLQVRALSMIGVAQSYVGDGGRRELERAIELGRGGVAPEETQNAYHNLAMLMISDGRVRDADALHAEAMAEVEPFGLLERVQHLTAQQAASAYLLGEWRRAEELLERYDELTTEAQGFTNRWLVPNIRGNIAWARGDRAAAVARARESVAYGRRANQFTALARPLPVLARLLLEEGCAEEAAAVTDELVALIDKSGGIVWRALIDLAWLYHDRGRGEAPPSARGGEWNDPAQAIARGELVAAADLLAATDLVAEEAYARLRAAEQLAAEGQDAEAQVHAEKAATFYGSVDASAYLARAEAVLRQRAPLTP